MEGLVKIMPRRTGTKAKGSVKMNSLEDYAHAVNELAIRKGWSQDWRWLITGYFAESGELVNTVLHGRPENEIAEEFADVMHYLLQLVKQKCPDTDLDRALKKKIALNYEHLKKTTNEVGEIVRK